MTAATDPRIQDIHDTEVHYTPVSHHFHDHTGVESNVAVAVSSGDTSVVIDDATGFLVGSYVFVTENGSVNKEEVNHNQVTAVATNTLTLDGPLSNDYSTDAVVEIVEPNIASTAGTLGSPVAYEAGPHGNQVWHLDRILLSMRCSTSPDDSKFGNLAALTNGVVLQYVRDDVVLAVSNWKSNDDMVDDMFDITYTTKAGAGDHGVRGRYTFIKAGWMMRLDGALNERVQILVQDDITLLVNMHMKAQGHFQVNEAR